jgi:hypothetical protein
MMLMFLFSVSALAFQDSFGVYVKHHWEDLGSLKAQSCCTTTADMNGWLERNFTILGIVGLISCVFMSYGCLCAVRILTVPIIMKNMLVVINIMFFGAAFMIMGVGVFALDHDEVEAGNKWIAILFISMAAFTMLISFVGVIGARNKSRSLLMGYIIGTSILLLLAISSGVGGFVFASSLDEQYVTEQGSDIACTIGLHGCTNCSDYRVPVLSPCNWNSTFFAPSCNDESTCERGVFGEPGFGEAECSKGETADGKRLVCEPPEHKAFATCKFQGEEAGKRGGGGGGDQWACCGDFDDPNDLSCDYYSQINDCGQCFEWSHRDIEVTITTNIKLLGLISFLMIVFVIVGLSGAIVLRQSLADYQCDSI